MFCQFSKRWLERLMFWQVTKAWTKIPLCMPCFLHFLFTVPSPVKEVSEPQVSASEAEAVVKTASDSTGGALRFTYRLLKPTTLQEDQQQDQIPQTEVLKTQGET